MNKFILFSKFTNTTFNYLMYNTPNIEGDTRLII